MARKNALIIVDIQNDFCKGGALAVPDAEAIIPLANELQAYFDLVVATQDWHPEDHMSFASNHAGHKIGEVVKIDDMAQILWPKHCVQNSTGAEFHPEFKLIKVKKTFHKGIDKKIDSYSAFYDNAHKRSTGLADYLSRYEIKDVYIMGLATDYCVKYSSLDAVKLGFNVYVIADACRGVELTPGDVNRAYEEMKQAGIGIIHSTELFNKFKLEKCL